MVMAVVLVMVVGTVTGAGPAEAASPTFFARDSGSLDLEGLPARSGLEVVLEVDTDDDPANGVIERRSTTTQTTDGTVRFQHFAFGPGRHLRVRAGTTTGSYRIPTLRLEDIDYQADVLAGRGASTASSAFLAFQTFEDGNELVRWTESTDGTFRVDFTTAPRQRLDIGTTLRAFEFDGNGNVTGFDWTYARNVEYTRDDDGWVSHTAITGYGWRQGDEVVVRQGQSVVATPRVGRDKTWRVEAVDDLRPGDTITVVDGDGVTKTLTIEPSTLVLDVERQIWSGQAAPGSRITLDFALEPVEVDASGFWSTTAPAPFAPGDSADMTVDEVDDEGTPDTSTLVRKVPEGERLLGRGERLTALLPGTPDVRVRVTSPVAGVVRIMSLGVEVIPVHYDDLGFGPAATILAPPTTAGNPLLVELSTDLAGLPSHIRADQVGLTHEGMAVPPCRGDGATPDPCLQARDTKGDRVVLTARSTLAGEWAMTVPFVDLSTEVVKVLGGPQAISATTLSQARDVTTARVVKRIEGPTRFATAAMIARDAFPEPGTVFVTTGNDFPDALAGGAAAAAVSPGAPVLLTSPTSLSAETRTEIEARGSIHRIVVLGGPQAVSPAVEAELRSFAPTERIGGADRFETAAAVTRQFFPDPVQTVYMATGTNFPDALGATAAAAAFDAPVMLATPTGLPTSTARELARLDPSTVKLVGGNTALGPEVVDAIRDLLPGATIQRLDGSDRFATNAMLVADAFPDRVPTVYLATGEAFPDALSGGPAAATHGAPILLTRRDGIPEAVVAEMARMAGRR